MPSNRFLRGTHGHVGWKKRSESPVIEETTPNPSSRRTWDRLAGNPVIVSILHPGQMTSRVSHMLILTQSEVDAQVVL